MTRASIQASGRKLRGYPGIKLKCVNLVPRYNYRSGAQSGTAQLWGDWEWTAWIKPQIDMAKANGFNCTKLILMGPGVAEASTGQSYGGTYPGATTLYNRFRQLCDYLNSQQMSLVLNLAQGGDWVFNKADTAATLTAMVMVCGWCETIPGCPVVEIDVMNELNYGRPSTWGGVTGAQTAMLNDVVPLIARAKAATGVPISSSVNITSSGQWLNDLVLAISPFVDINDLHLYYNSGIPDISHAGGFLGSSSFKGSFWIGEYGLTHGENDTQIANYVAGVKTITRDQRCWGQNFWCAATYYNAQGGGTTYTGAILDTGAANARTGILTPLATFPAF